MGRAYRGGEAWRRGASAGSVRCGLGSTRFRVAVADRCVAMTTLPPPVIQPPPPPDHCLCPTHPRLLPSPMPLSDPLTHPRSRPSILPKISLFQSSYDPSRPSIEFRAENKIKIAPPNFVLTRSDGKKSRLRILFSLQFHFVVFDFERNGKKNGLALLVNNKNRGEKFWRERPRMRYVV